MTLKRYKKYHRIKFPHNSNKKELAEAVSQHFLQQSIDDEDTVINAFVAHVKCMLPLLLSLLSSLSSIYLPLFFFSSLS